MEAGQGQASEHGGENQLEISVQKEEADIDIATRYAWLDSLKEKQAGEKPGDRKMHKVPGMFLADDKSTAEYKPKLVSLGPYHWGNAELKPFQDRKVSMAQRFVPDKRLEASLRRKIRRDIAQLKAPYPEQEIQNFDSTKWEEMLFLDGCFVLYFIFCFTYDRVEDLEMNGYEIDKVHNDLFLLENQLPFQLLNILSGNDEMLPFLLDIYIDTYKISIDVDWDLIHDEPIHLLDRLRNIIIGGRSETQWWPTIWWQLILGSLINPDWCSRLTQNKDQPERNVPTPSEIKSTVLRHAKDLTDRGIHLKPNRSGLLKDISFKSNFIYGTLRLPRIIVDASTRPLLLNLAAYEMCAGIRSTITSYICFMDSLVNRAEDIKELQSAGVLASHLPTNEDAANLFNKMSQGLCPDTDVYMEVKRKIHTFLQNKPKASLASWVAEGYQNHFKSPLTAMSVLAVILAIALSATQTYFTIFPRANK